MNTLRKILLAFVLLFSVRAAAQNDSLQLPRLVVKTSIAPLYALVFRSSVIPADISMEAKLSDHFSVQVTGTTAFRGIFKSRYVHPRGFSLRIIPKYYFLKTTTFFLGLESCYGQEARSLTVEIPAVNGNFLNGSYYKRTRVSEKFFSFTPMVGWNGAAWTDVKFPIEFAAGPSVTLRNFSFTNLNQQEINSIADGHARGIELDPPRRHVQLMIALSITVGIVVAR